MRWKCLLDSCFRSWQRAVSFVILFSARVCSKPLTVSGEILIKTTVVSLVHELFVGFEVHFFAHHHCGRPFVSRFDKDVSSSLESFKCLSFFLREVVSPVPDVLSLTPNVPFNCFNVCLQGCVTITMGCPFAFLFESLDLGRFIFLCHLWVIKEFPQS